jgi:hypothetical protein
VIRLTRIRSEATIHASFYGDKKKTFEKELLVNQRLIAQGQLKKHPFDSNRWKKAKPQLIAETGGKCAYCEAPTTLVTYGDVEHYRPKSTYWWLAYCYDNYLISCVLCNQKFKKANFPIRNAKMEGPTIQQDTTDADIESQAGMIVPNPLELSQVNEFIELHRQERPLLLNPYFDEPEEFFAWRTDEVLMEVELISLPTNLDAKAFCDAAIAHYGLNRKKLKDYRWDRYDQYRTFRDVLNDPRLSERTRSLVRQQIEKMKAPDAPFAGMIRYFDSLP